MITLFTALKLRLEGDVQRMSVETGSPCFFNLKKTTFLKATFKKKKRKGRKQPKQLPECTAVAASRGPAHCFPVTFVTRTVVQQQQPRKQHKQDRPSEQR